VVDVIRKVRTDEQGNLIFEADATVEDSDSFGSYMPTAKVIQLSIDQVFADAKGQPVTEETVVNSLTKTLNHEVYHAIRNLDLVTQEEVELLEGLARKYRKKGTEGADGQPLTYASWADQGYSDLNSAKITEEAVAELISDSLAGEVIADGQTITIGGKPRNIIQRIVDFFKSMVGFTSSAKARNFSDFLGKLDAGEVGARERGEIRTPYLTDYARAEKMKRGVGKQRLADQPIVQLEEEDVESRRAEDPIAAPDKGINVRTDNETNYAGLIVSGQKQYESRDTDSLRPYVGKRVGIVETGSGPAKLVGYATVGEPVEVGETEFAGSREQHLVPEGSRFDIKPGQTKFLYEMIEPEPLSQPIDVSSSRGIVARNIAGFDKPSESRRVGRPDTATRPEVERAYQQLQEGEIGRDKYDAVVRGTISEYDFVPQPATTQEMFGALDKNKKEKINLPIEEASEVGLRLDIPAYTNHGVWVPTIHAKGKASHRATAAINNADFTRTPQGKAQKVMEGGSKSPFAQIKGNFVNRTDAENEAIAQQALNDPAWTQVGFDPRRHSYFYDRKTGEAVTTADEVVQVGPLVLAKNAVKDPTFQEETLYSKRVNVSVVPIFKGEEAPPKMKGKTQVAQFLETRAKDSIGKVRNIALEEDRDAIAEDLAEEAAYEMEKQGNALEWYDDTISKTLELLSEKHPEIKKDPNAKTPFLASLAITSQNMSVPENLRYAEQVYNEYKLTGRFPEVGFGEKGGSMKANFIKANKLLDRLGSVQEVEKFLQTKFKVSELNKVTKDFLGQKAETGELADTEVFGSAIFGPKIGNGFYTNLRGDFSPVTMDMWFMRTMGRLSGRLMDLDRDRFDAQLDRLAKAESMEQASEAELIDRAKQLKSQHEKDFKNFRDEYDAGIRKQSESTLAAKNIIKSVTGTRDVPANGTERKHLRDITMRAIEKLEAKTGQKIEPAAFQALIWYPEQDLYKNLGVNLRHVRQDYATSTEQLLLEEGYDPRKLKRAKDRVRERAKRRARGLRPDAGAVEQRADRLRAGQLDSVVPEEATARRKLTTRKHPPAKVEEAVIKDEILAEDMQGFPRVNFQAEPDAQYVAQDPDAGYEPQFDESQLASRRTPDRSRSYEESIDAVLGDRPVGPTQYETYQEATGEGKLDYWLTKFKQGAINRFARLEALNRDPALRDNLADSSSIAAALFADRSRGVVSAAIKHGVPVYRNGITKVEDFSHNGVQYRGLVDLMSKLYSEEHGDLTKDAQAYAIAKRGERLESKSGKPAPLSKEQREEIILNAEQYIDDNGRKIIEDWYNAWQAYNNYTIRFLKDTGVLNNETAALWEKYSDYVPFYRAAAGEGNAPAIAQRVFGGDLTAKAHIKEYKGSKDKIDVPLTEAIGLNLTAAIEMGMRNVAQQRIIRDMQTIGLAKQLKKGEAATADLVTLKVDGKEVRFDVYDPLVFESMQSLPDQGFLVNNVFGAPARFLREMITRDPGFMMVNMLRDTLSTFTTSGSNFVPVVDTLRGYADGMDTLERTGVVGGYDYSNDPDNVVKFYQKEMKRRGIGPEGGRGSPLGMFTSIWDALGNATTRSDAATRNAVYKDVLARTGNEAEANFQALEVINFSRRGANALARVLTATIPFLNARFQGLDVFYRAGKGEYTANKELSRRQAIQSFVTRAGMLTALTALYYTLVSDDDQYKEQSEEIRDNNWIIPTASGVPVKIPIPFEVGLVFKTIPETILAATVGDKSSKEARDTIQRGIVSTLEINPLGVQAISPLVEASMNHSFYTGRDIVPYYIDANVATGLQDRVSTTEMGKFIGSELGISPIKVDHVMTGYSGTLGGYVLSAVDAILRSEAVTGDEAAKMPALKIYEYPIIKRFFASEQGSGLRQDAYELYREINKVVTTSNKLKKEGRLEELNSYLSSKQHLLDLKSPVYNIKGKLDQSRRSRDAIMRMDIDAERKREMIDDIDENINEMLKVIPALKKRADLPAFESGLAQRITGG